MFTSTWLLLLGNMMNSAGRRAKRTKTEVFLWKPNASKFKRVITAGVPLLVSCTNAEMLLVKKLLELDPKDDVKESKQPPEIAALAVLPDYNRLAKPILCSHADSDPEYGTALFQHYQLGDLEQWKRQQFDSKNWKPPPENTTRGINNRAADVWAVDACIHFLATGKEPIEDSDAYAARRYRNNNNQHPASARFYDHEDRYYDAHVARRAIPINLSKIQLHQRGLGLSTEEKRAQGIGPEYHQYSDELNDWMMQHLSRTPSRRRATERLVYGMSLEAMGMLKKIGRKSALVDMDAQFGIDA
ncbi:hypothetical protein G6011_11186 [Alternaria panax]|uniref:Uncharacterized protein n=1 Tax=Alternaria panax TaxID=48097 RepID=A0AAD4IDA1_9PLEO|nr:hypothetical protein G6011_11186 [Alternaria panax]